MEPRLRYPELFLAPRERAEESFWISLGYFSLYRIAVATLFLALTVVYDDELKFGAHWLDLFRYVAGGYLFLAVVLHGVLRSRRNFNLQLSLHACLDIVAITLLMYASGGVRSGLGVMLLISLIGAALVAPLRLAYLYAALASIALLLEQGYWVLAHDAPTTDFLPPSLLAASCFAGAGITSWLAQRVAANERLARERGRELEIQTRVNQLVIQDMHDGVVVLDRDGRVVQHNPRAQRLLRAERLLGADIGTLVPRFAGTPATISVRGRDIGLRLLETGRDEGYRVLFIEDTTRAREQAQQLKLAALGRLTAGVAHEIRNPLAAISHAAELLLEEKRGEDRERLAEIIRDNTLRLERLVADVLQLSRRDRMSAEPIRAAPWLEEFLGEFVANEAVPRSRFAVEAPPGLWVHFDREHLRQVLWNLLRNAVRYASGAPGSVRIVARGDADGVELGVLDDGPGVPAAGQAQLFEPFFTTEAKGTGLGLYLARELCAANRATLEYVAEAAGAHFRVLCREARPA
ncbi:MAG: two-component system sensor histidine kinase NtrB [Betaproteobacteria bacterium]